MILENCSMQKKGNIDNNLRTEKSCETTPTSKIDYGKRPHVGNTFATVLAKEPRSSQSAMCLSTVYKVRVEETTNDLSTDIYSVRVLEVIKEGGYMYLGL